MMLAVVVDQILGVSITAAISNKALNCGVKNATLPALTFAPPRIYDFLRSLSAALKYSSGEFILTSSGG
jgi:hypothetical protein